VTQPPWRPCVCLRLNVYAGPGDPAVRADPGRPWAGAGRRPPGHAQLAEQPRTGPNRG